MPEVNNKTRVRSPAYPSVGLSEAIEKLKVLYSQQKRNAVNVEVAINTLGFKSLGYGGRCIAAMKMFGLLQDEGKLTERMVKITTAGLNFILYDATDPDYASYLYNAATSPTVYREMLTEWPESLPTDMQIRKWLIQKGFNPDYIQSLIDNFRATYEFANLGESGTLREQESDKPAASDGTENDVEMQPAPVHPPYASFHLPSKNADAGSPAMPTPTDAFSLPIPLPGKRFAFLYTPMDLSEAEYTRIQKFLTDNKDVVLPSVPAVVKEQTQDEDQP